MGLVFSAIGGMYRYDREGQAYKSLERTILLSYPNALNFEARRHFNRAHRPAISNPGVSRHVGLAMNYNDRPRSLCNRKVVTDIGYIDSMGQPQLTVNPVTAFAN